MIQGFLWLFTIKEGTLTHYILDKRQDEKQTPFPIIEPVYCPVIACFNNDNRRLFSNCCFLPPGLSFPSLRSGSHDLIIPFMELANRFSQWFAEYLHHCTLYLQAAASPWSLFIDRALRTISCAPFKMCAQYVRQIPGCAAHERSRPDFRELFVLTRDIWWQRARS